MTSRDKPSLPRRHALLGWARPWRRALRVALLGSTLGLPAASAPGLSHAAPATAEQAVATTLPEALDLVLLHPLLAEATLGVSVIDLGTGGSLYARSADLPLNPASNQKLITTAAALLILGPEHKYVTRILRNDGGLSGSVVTGDVYLQGSGDPELVTEDLLTLAAELKARGIRRITGGITVDASAFDRDELPPGFDQKQELASYRAPSGAVSVNFNTFVLRVASGGKIGDPALAGIDPPVSSIKVVNLATTAAGNRANLFAELKSEHGEITVEVRGKIGVDASATKYRYPIEEPAKYAGDLLAYALKQHGIKLGNARVKLGKPPAKARGLAAHFSRPLGSLIRPVNKFSNNFMAEQILKTLADPTAPASFATALARVARLLNEAGLPMEGVSLGNGSGLYDTNRITPQLVTALLAKMYGDFRYQSEFLASLSVMGVDGTTRSRLDQTEADRWVRVKTGTLDGISALSGYVSGPGRAPLAFCILLNDLPKHGTASARTVQDELVLVLSRYAADKPLVAAPL